MKRTLFFTLIAVVLATAPMTSAQVDWRFGFEYNEIGPWFSPHHGQLLNKLAKIGSPGGINVNGLGSWSLMQEGAAAPISFTLTDPVVTLFQRHGFSLTWYLRSDAPWAFPSKQIPTGGTAAPDLAFEEHWKNYVKAIVERYDGDGIDDMPGLVIPIQFYIMIGEVKFGKTGQGDEEKGPFWFDTIDNLLRLHRITYEAIREADPTGNSRVVSSGAVLWDLYADFPDWPEFDPSDTNSTIQRRLRGENYRGSTYTAGWDSLKKMLKSFGNDADGIECDYIGWHPHFNWRGITQEFEFIHAYAGSKPIYVDDMWTNIFSSGYNWGASIPGGAQFHAPPWPPANSDWIKEIEGDFPNSLFPSIDPHGTLFTELLNGNMDVTNWYYARQARNVVKSFVTAFGEGAERACLSGTNDLQETRNWLFGSFGWINILGPRREGYPEKPGYYTYRLLVDKLHNFTKVSEIPISQSPLTRCYKFDRADTTSIYVLWSETGEAPPNLDYRIATGDTVTFEVESDAMLVTHIITDTMNTTPELDTLIAQDRQVTIQLGYEPIFLEPIYPVGVQMQDYSLLPASFALDQNYPNPFNSSTTISYQLSAVSSVNLNIYNLLGQKIRTIVNERQVPGFYQVKWDGTNDAGMPVVSGVYIYRLQSGSGVQTKKMILMQ